MSLFLLSGAGRGLCPPVARSNPLLYPHFVPYFLAYLSLFFMCPGPGAGCARLNPAAFSINAFRVHCTVLMP